MSADSPPRPHPRPSLLVDIPGAARLLATSERHVRRLAQERRIPFVKVGHFVRFDLRDIERWLEAQKVVEVARPRRPKR